MAPQLKMRQGYCGNEGRFCSGEAKVETVTMQLGRASRFSPPFASLGLGVVLSFLQRLIDVREEDPTQGTSEGIGCCYFIGLLRWRFHDTVEAWMAWLRGDVLFYSATFDYLSNWEQTVMFQVKMLRRSSSICKSLHMIRRAGRFLREVKDFH